MLTTTFQHANSSAQSAEYGALALAFVREVRDLDTASRIAGLLQNFIEQLGFDNVICVGLTTTFPDPKAGLLMNTRPAAWTDAYFEHSHYIDDPIIEALRRERRPLTWTEALRGRQLTQSQHDLMNMTVDFGMDEGFAIPIFDVNGRLGIVSAAGQGTKVTAEVRDGLTVAGLAAHARFMALRETHRETKPALSAREIEVLHWIADGKSDLQIADVLNISAKTVNYHVENAKRKLGVASRVQAVLSAIRNSVLPY